MKTAHKIAIAKTLYYCIKSFRLLGGARSETATKKRHGLWFDLDLRQGIDLAIFLGQYEPTTTEELARSIKPGTVVLDIGANIGFHTLNMARATGPNGRVFAFEPTKYAFTKLKKNLTLNPELAKTVEAHQCFLGSGQQSLLPKEIYSSWPLTATEPSTLHTKHLGQSMGTDEATMISLDNFLEAKGCPRVSLVKIDVDGFERDVLSGATAMIARDRPIFVMEIAPHVLLEHDTSAEELLNFFTPYGYRFFKEGSAGKKELKTEEILGIVSDGESMNIVAMVS